MTEPRRRRRKPGAVAYSQEWRERVSLGVRRANERQRALFLHAPSDLRAMRDPLNPVGERRPCVLDALQELHDLIDHLGGEQRATVVEMALARSAARLLIPEQALAIQFAQTGDAELASRLATVIGQRRALLLSLGVERRAHDVGSLESFWALREAAGASIATRGSGDDGSRDRGACSPPGAVAPSCDPPSVALAQSEGES